MTSPADPTPRCPVCGLYPNVRGCEPGKCLGGKGFAIVHEPIRPGATWYADPGDSFNGHPLSAFCESCRLGILEIGRGETAGVDLCRACSGMIGRPSQFPSASSPEKVIVSPALEARARELFPGVPIEVVPTLAADEWRIVTRAAGSSVSHVSIAPDGSATFHGGPPPKTKGANDNTIAHDHPAPWEWEDGKLKDGDGALLLWPERSGPDLLIRRCCDNVREVTALAPELEQLLDEAMGWLEDSSAYAQKGEPRRFDERARAALARLDAARKAGRDG